MSLPDLLNRYTVFVFYSQGCSKATIGAVTLDAILRQPRYSKLTHVTQDFGREFFKLHKDKIQDVWDGTKPTGPFIISFYHILHTEVCQIISGKLQFLSRAKSAAMNGLRARSLA